MVATRSVVIGPVTKYLTIASFSIGYFLGVIFTYIPIRDFIFRNFRDFSPALWLLLIPAFLLSVHAEFIRRTVLAAIQFQNRPAPAPEEPGTEQVDISKSQPVEALPVKSIAPAVEKKASPKTDALLEQKHGWLDRPIHSSLPAITNEVAVFILILDRGFCHALLRP